MSEIQYNALHGMADVFAPDGTLLGAVPHDRHGCAAGADAVTTYQTAARDLPETVTIRLRAARRVIVLAGGTPNVIALRGPHGDRAWETAVRKHQRVLRIAADLNAPALLAGLVPTEARP